VQEGGLKQRGSVSNISYLSLQGANEQVLENLARLVAVADVLECLCRVLATYIEEDFLTTAVKQQSVIHPDIYSADFFWRRLLARHVNA
jgi:hypothetical protein